MPFGVPTPCASSTAYTACSPRRVELSFLQRRSREPRDTRPSLVDTIDWTRPLTFIVRGDAYPCAGGSWTELSVGLPNHNARGRTPAYLWVIGMAVCGDKDMAAVPTIWADHLKVCGPFDVC